VDAFERYEGIADDLVARNPDVELTQMMGMPAIKAAGKLVGGFVRSADAMIFKLPDAGAHERALALAGAALFDPMGGRPMREWVQVPAAHADDWLALAEQALALRRG
jgi:hypothetical protein